MSGIAGAAVRPEHVGPGEWLAQTVDRLLAALSHCGGVSLPSSGLPSAVLNEARGTGVGARWVDSSCALGIQWLPQTPEAVHEVQPLRDEASGCVLVWDGRLDNREELAESLGTHSRQLADSALALGAFLRWREACAARLLGDFAFAVWDPRERLLYAARDPMGVRPFFYHAHAGRLCFASDFQALLRLAHVPREPDEVTAGEALLWWTSFPDVERTFYRDVRRLPPAHWLRWDANGLHLERYWDIDPSRRLRYRRQEYLDQFLELLSRAVACRLRAPRDVGIFLSGGMDSSAVAMLAGRLNGAHGAVRAYHLPLVDDPNDESGMAELVAAQAGISYHAYVLQDENMLGELESYVRLHGEPTAGLPFWTDLQLLHRAATQDCGAILTGDGSDELFNFAWAYVADLIRSLRWIHLGKNLGPLARYYGRTPAFLLKNAARFVAPRPALRLWKRIKWRQAPPWVSPEFARRTGLVERLRWVRPRRPFDSRSADEDYTTLTRGARVFTDERRDLEAARLAVEFRFPFYDRRLLEFMFAVPWEEKIVGWRVKSFLWETPGLLPEPLRCLRRKANYLPYAQRLRDVQDWASLRALFSSPPPRAADYVHLPAARRICHAFLDQRDGSQQQSFLGLAAFFLWLKHVP